MSLLFGCILSKSKNSLSPGDTSYFTESIFLYYTFPTIFFRRNILGYSNDDELRNCRFTKDHPHNQFCPIFVLGDIVSYTGSDFTELANKVLELSCLFRPV